MGSLPIRAGARGEESYPGAPECASRARICPVSVATSLRPAPPETLPGRIVRFPVIRIVLFAAGIGGALELSRLVTGTLDGVLGAWWPSAGVNWVLSIVVVHCVYRGLTRLLEGRIAVELARRDAANETAAGAVIGAGLLALTVAVVAAPRLLPR